MKTFQAGLIAASLLLGNQVQAIAQDMPPDITKTQFKAVDYDPKLDCGACIAGGWNFCWKSDETGLIMTDDQYPKNTGDFADTNLLCCKKEEYYVPGSGLATDESASATDGACWSLMADTRSPVKMQWRCSQAYTNNAYAQLMCPYRRSSCGPNKNINFYTDQDDGAIHIIGLKKGESCTYNIESVCGAPSFYIENQSESVTVFYNEWQQDQVAMVTPVTNKPFNNEELEISSPLQDYPTRNVDFIEENGAVERGPVYGTYEGNGWRYWNQLVQDEANTEEQVGRRYEKDDNTCKLRNLLLTVLNTDKDDADVELLLQLKSAKFSAIYLKNVLATAMAALGIVVASV